MAHVFSFLFGLFEILQIIEYKQSYNLKQGDVEWYCLKVTRYCLRRIVRDYMLL